MPRRTSATGLEASVRTTQSAKSHRRRACSATSASSANATPSANGNAPVRTKPAQTSANAPSPSARAPPPGAHELRERDRRDRGAEHREEPDPEQRRERVVEDAVADEAVPARVPVVVPEDEAVPEEERALVRVRGEVGPGRPEPHEQRRDRAGGRRGDERVTMARQHERKRTLVA